MLYNARNYTKVYHLQLFKVGPLLHGIYGQEDPARVTETQRTCTDGQDVMCGKRKRYSEPDNAPVAKRRDHREELVDLMDDPITAKKYVLVRKNLEIVTRAETRTPCCFGRSEASHDIRPLTEQLFEDLETFKDSNSITACGKLLCY